MKGPSLDDLIADERENPPVPAEGGAEKGWRRVQNSVALGIAAPFDLPPAAVAPVVAKAAGTIAIAKVALAAVVGVGGIFVAARVITPEPPEPASSAVPAQPVPRGETPVVQGEADEPADAAPIEPEIAAPPPVEAEAPVDPAPSSPEVADVEPEVPPHSTRRGRSRAAREAEPPAPVGIGRELDLIKRAGQAVNQGKHAQALAILKTHAKEFPAGALTEDREALRAIAQCASEGAEASAGVSASFSARFPRSVHAARVLEACSLDSKVNP